MKIAVCMSSVIRHFEPCWKSFVDLVIDRLDAQPDFYGHFVALSTSAATIAATDTIKLIEPHVASMEVTFQSDPPIPADWLAKTKRMVSQRHGIRGNLLQWNSMRQVMSMVQGRYDVILWTRPDLLFLKPIERPLPQGGLYLPNHCNWRGLHDRFAYGPPELMQVRCGEIADYFHHWYATKARPPRWNPEVVLRDLLEDRGIVVRRTQVVTARVREDGRRLEPTWN
jgi:hypothetical protein